MWLCPFIRKEKVRISISLSVSKKLHGLRIWNYNKSPEDTYRGVSASIMRMLISFSRSSRLPRWNDSMFNWMIRWFHLNKAFCCDVHQAIVISTLLKRLFLLMPTLLEASSKGNSQKSKPQFSIRTRDSSVHSGYLDTALPLAVKPMQISPCRTDVSED